MNCKQCNLTNDDNAKFCKGCGENLILETNSNSKNSNNNKNQKEENKAVVSNNDKVSATENNTTIAEITENNEQTNNNDKIDFVGIIIGMITKPATTIKNLLNKFDNINFSGIIAGIVVIVGVLSRLFNLIFSTVVYRTWSSRDGYSSYKLDFDRLENFKFLTNFFDSLVGYALIIASITCIYYMISLILKQDIKFSKLLGITSLSLIPVIIFSSVLSPVLTIIYSNFGIICSLAGLIFTGILLHEEINNLLTFDDDKKIFINTLNLTITAIISTLIIIEFFTIISIEDLALFF